MPRGAALRYVTRGCPPARAASPVPGRAAAARAPGSGRGAAALRKALRPSPRAAERRADRRVRQCGRARRAMRGLRTAGERLGAVRAGAVLCGACRGGDERRVLGCRSPSCRRAPVPSSCAAPGPLGRGLSPSQRCAVASEPRRAPAGTAGPSEPRLGPRGALLRAGVWEAEGESLAASHCRLQHVPVKQVLSEALLGRLKRGGGLRGPAAGWCAQ